MSGIIYMLCNTLTNEFVKLVFHRISVRIGDIFKEENILFAEIRNMWKKFSTNRKDKQDINERSGKIGCDDYNKSFILNKRNMLSILDLRNIYQVNHPVLHNI